MYDMDNVFILSFQFLTIIDAFSSGLVRFHYLAYPVFDPVFDNSDLESILELKCQSENKKGFILTNFVRLHP